MDFDSGRCTVKIILIATILLISCPRTTHAVNPVAMLQNSTISLSTAKSIGYGLGTLASVCLFEHCFKKLDDALGQLKFDKRNTPEERNQNEVSCKRWAAACIGCAATAIVGSALLCRNIVPDSMIKSNTIGMAAAKSAGFGLLAIPFYSLYLSWLFQKRKAGCNKYFGRVPPALVSALQAGGATFLFLANAGNCLRLIAGKR